MTVNVRGYDWPRAWLGTPMTLGSQFVVRGGVGLTRSGVPVAGMRLEIRDYCEFANQEGYGRTLRAVRTNIQGRFFYYATSSQLRNSAYACAAAVTYPTDTYDSFVVQSNIRSHG